MKRLVAFLILWRFPSKLLTVSVFHRAEVIIIKLLQKSSFPSELQSLSCAGAEATIRNKKTSKLHQLDPILDCEGLIRVGGRLGRSAMDVNEKHPILLPRQSQVTKLIIGWCHENVQHGGRGMTLNELSKNGFWVINGNFQVRFFIMKCVKCIKLSRVWQVALFILKAPIRWIQTASFNVYDVSSADEVPSELSDVTMVPTLLVPKTSFRSQ